MVVGDEHFGSFDLIKVYKLDHQTLQIEVFLKLVTNDHQGGIVKFPVFELLLRHIQKHVFVNSRRDLELADEVRDQIGPDLVKYAECPILMLWRLQLDSVIDHLSNDIKDYTGNDRVYV